jgi:GT2 family glycosyltransferase
MLLSRKCLEAVGLLEESPFLYYEELDLAARIRPAFHLGYSAESVVYHKEGASIGSAHIRANRSVLCQARNRIIFSRRYHPWFVPFVLGATGLSALQRFLIGRPQNASVILRGVFARCSRAHSRGRVF